MTYSISGRYHRRRAAGSRGFVASIYSVLGYQLLVMAVVSISVFTFVFFYEMIRNRESNINFILKNFLSLVFFPKCGGHTCDPILLFLVVYTIAARAVSKFRFLR